MKINLLITFYTVGRYLLGKFIYQEISSGRFLSNLPNLSKKEREKSNY
jgi:hypothetical protein